jgi:ABC-type taurine transport system ATPase subunit
MHRIGDHSGGGCHLGVYLDILHTRVVGRLEDDFQRRWFEWGHVQHRIGDHSGGGCHLGFYLDVLHTRVVRRLEDDFQRRWLEWGHGG